jgi:hypothetical protein
MDYKEKGIMKRIKLSAIFAALSVVGMGALLVGCGDSAGGSTNSDAQQQFLAERGSGTPGVVTDTTGLDGGFGPGGGPIPGAFGVVDKIEGNKIYTKNPTSGEASTIQLADSAKIYKQMEIEASEIKVGDAILANGTTSGDAVDAIVVEVAEAGALDNLRAGGGRIFGGGPGGTRGAVPQGTPGAFPRGTPGAQRTPGVRRGQGGLFPQGTPGVPGGPGSRIFEGTPVIGIVEKVDGGTITVKPETAGGPTIVRLGADTRIQKQAEIALSALEVGNTVSASGTQEGDAFNATRLQVIDATRFQAP